MHNWAWENFSCTYHHIMLLDDLIAKNFRAQAIPLMSTALAYTENGGPCGYHN